MTRDLIIGIDAGTTACKVLAVASDGRVVASAASNYPLHQPMAGWAEQDVHEVWAGVRTALRLLLAQISTQRIAGISLSGAMHGVMPVDAAGQPLGRAMTWADNRAVAVADALREAEGDGGQSIYEQTGCPLRWLYMPAKLRWMKEQQPSLFTQAARFVAIKDWLIFRFTGIWATDICLASGTGLLDLRTHQWSEKALSMAGIDAGRLCRLAQPQEVVGEITHAAASETGLPQGLPVMPGGGDGGMANIGAGGAKVGSVVVTVGTSGAVRVTTRQPLLDAAQRTWCYALTKDRWYAGGAINNGGLAVETIRRMFYGELEKDEGFSQLFDDAATISAGSDGVLLLPYFGGERNPHWRPDLRAAMHGLTSAHSRAHIARAVLEGVAFCLADVWAALRQTGELTPEKIRLTGGITKSRLWSQIVCDVLGLPVMLSESGDASAMGAAAIGHWGLGHVSSLEAFEIAEDQTITLEPDAKNHAICTEKHAEFQLHGRRMMEAVTLKV